MGSGHWRAQGVGMRTGASWRGGASWIIGGRQDGGASGHRSWGRCRQPMPALCRHMLVLLLPLVFVVGTLPLSGKGALQWCSRRRLDGGQQRVALRVRCPLD